MRDGERFNFRLYSAAGGHMGPAGVLAAIAAAPGDLRLGARYGNRRVASGGLRSSRRGAENHRRLPFVERQDHPAGLPVVRIAGPSDAIVNDVEMWSVRVAGWGARSARHWQADGSRGRPGPRIDGAALLVPVRRPSRSTDYGCAR